MTQQDVSKYLSGRSWGFPGDSDNNLSAMWETCVQSLGQKSPLEKVMATHSPILAWKIPRTEEPGRPQFRGSQRVRDDRVTNIFTFKRN